jgi:anti-sigma regulatory factor (Ser/Thr protein kinase)
VIEVSVRDHGQWRPQRAGDQGRGFALMEALVDDVDVTRSAEGTTVSMLRKLSSDGGGA